MSIADNLKQIFKELPPEVSLVAAVKGRSAEDILRAVEAGITLIGENYIQEAESLYPYIGKRAKWHFIGHLQKNKVKKAVRLFDVIETVDSLTLADEINKRAREIGKIMPVFIEINSGLEPQKSGVFLQGQRQILFS